MSEPHADKFEGPGFVVAGTDTGIGKTVFAAALAGALGADYWKPVQAGLDGPTDSETVRELAGSHIGQTLPEAYLLTLPASPHAAAAHDGIEIDVARLVSPQEARVSPRPLVIELAGGLLVPLTPSVLQIDIIARWQLPVVLVARTALGTINHSLLSLEALRARSIPVAGVAFVGEAQAMSETTIARIGNVKRLGRLPVVEPLTPEGLRSAFADGFDLRGFR